MLGLAMDAATPVLAFLASGSPVVLHILWVLVGS